MPVFADSADCHSSTHPSSGAGRRIAARSTMTCIRPHPVIAVSRNRSILFPAHPREARILKIIAPTVAGKLLSFFNHSLGGSRLRSETLNIRSLQVKSLQKPFLPSVTSLNYITLRIKARGSSTFRNSVATAKSLHTPTSALELYARRA